MCRKSSGNQVLDVGTGGGYTRTGFIRDWRRAGCTEATKHSKGYGMAQGTTPVVAQRRLRAELRKAREDAGHTQKRVAEDLGWSLSKVIRLETGATSVSTSDAMALIHYYEITDRERIDDLLSVTRAKERAWWDEYSDLYGQQFLNFLAYEDSASRIRQFQTLAVPG